jgi:nucleoside-diphosphate-sugar epimerase
MLNDSSKLIIIGGSGFIGTRLINRLNKSIGYNIAIVDKEISLEYPNISMLADVRNKSALISTIFSCDTIINLAAEHRDDISPSSLYGEVNIDGAINVCAAARERDIKRIIFTSSVAVYGLERDGTSEAGRIAPFNEYGRTKWEAEKIYVAWQAEDTQNRSLVIVRPTVVFGEKNRGNVYNLFKQVSSGRFLMIGNGLNCKSMAYVENVAAFLEYSLEFKAGVHIYNYTDKPNLNMNILVDLIRNKMGINNKIKIRIPYYLGFSIGLAFDFLSRITGKQYPSSAIRVKKFCSNSVYESKINMTAFNPPIPLVEGIEKTIDYEFMK